MSLQLDLIQKWFWLMITKEKFFANWVTYHNKKVSPQLSSFISVQLDPVKNDFGQWSQEKCYSPVESL